MRNSSLEGVLSSPIRQNPSLFINPFNIFWGGVLHEEASGCSAHPSCNHCSAENEDRLLDHVTEANLHRLHSGIIDKYEALHPDVEIVWEDVPWDVLQQKLLAAFSSGNPPDVVNLNAQWTIEFAQKRVLFPIDELLPEEVLSQYFDDMMKGLTWKGHIYGIPWYTAVDVILYNKEIFEKLVLTPSTHRRPGMKFFFTLC